MTTAKRRKENFKDDIIGKDRQGKGNAKIHATDLQPRVISLQALPGSKEAKS